MHIAYDKLCLFVAKKTNKKTLLLPEYIENVYYTDYYSTIYTKILDVTLMGKVKVC